MSGEGEFFKWYPVADKNMIPLREGRRVFYGVYEAALFNLGDEFLAVDNHCPHKSGPLADGIVSGKAVFSRKLKFGKMNGWIILKEENQP